MTGHCFRGTISKARGDLYSQSFNMGFPSWGQYLWEPGSGGPAELWISRGQDTQAHAESGSLTRAVKALGPVGGTGDAQPGEGEDSVGAF